MNDLQEIFFPVRKLPVPPDEVDLIKIKILESTFKADDNGVIKEYRKVYYETSFKGNKVSDGNNYIPSDLVPLIFNAKDNAIMMDFAMQNFGFAIIHEVFEKNPNVFVNPYNSISTQPINPQEHGSSTNNTEINQTTEPTENTTTTGAIEQPTESRATPPAD